jgi:hypothetical protein
MARWRRDTVAIATALGLHVAVLGFLSLTRSHSSSVPESPLSPGATTWDLELSAAPEVEATTAPETPHEPASESPRSEQAATAHLIARVNAGREHEPLESEAAVVVEGSREPEAELEQEVQEAAPPQPIQLGLGPDGWQRWVSAPKEGEAPRAERAPARKNKFLVLRPQPKSTTGGLQEGLEAHDRSLGLGPQGRVLSALHRAAHAALSPDVGAARFEVTVHRSGAVEVTLASLSGRDEEWRNVAVGVANDLRAKPPRIPSPREGAKFVVELIVERTLPNGEKASEFEKPHLDVPPPNFQSSEEAKAQLKRENPTTTQNPSKEDVAIKLDAPGLYVAGRGTLGGYRAGLGVIAGRYGTDPGLGPTAQGTVDPSHIGAKPQRMVRARVIEQSLF